ncbi:MAG: serpin family protein [Spirochaetia bacterium]|jgi:serpin B
MKKVLVMMEPLFLILALGSLLSCFPTPGPTSLEDIAARALPYQHTTEKDSVVESVNAFSLGLYAQLASADDENIFFSPFSISSALAMAYAGAKGDTARQMAATLGFTLAQDAIPAAFGALLGDMNAVGALNAYELDTANSLWGQQDLPFLDDFLSVVKNSYGAPLQRVDFVTQTEQARIAINDWVSGRTHGKILDLLQQGSIDANTRLVLANAIYFKGAWARTFKEADTSNQPFQLANGSTATVLMMNQKAEFNYMENDLLKMLELPYTTGDLSMLFILPNYGRTLAEVESALNSSAFKLWTSQLNKVEELEVGIPRFSFAASFRLAEQLGKMGMTDAFEPASADFSGMTGSTGLSIGDVFHKAFVLVNEEGTEAAAATAVTVGVTAMGPSFTADHPFLFLIRHNLSGAILFFGRVMDPRSD